MDISATSPVVATPPAQVIDAGVDAAIDVTNQQTSFDDFYRLRSATIAQALAATLNDADLAADAANEAMTRAYQRWDKVRRYDKPEAWVYRVGLNWSRSWRQRRRREQERPVQLSSPTTDLGERDASLDGAVSQLSLDHRAVVVCRIYLDWSVEQTAEALKIAPGTVKSRLARAITALRTHIDADDPNGDNHDA